MKFKSLVLYMLQVFFISFCFFIQPLYASQEKVAKSVLGEGFALVELYTSEGCSSCPVADQLLVSITESARASQQKIYTLGFHVDYWDYLGWKDVFSQAIFTQRQRYYAAILKSNSVYTPQMIINGKHAFGGYKGAMAERLIKQSLTGSSQTGIEVSVLPKGNALNVQYALSGNINSQLINFALVEKNRVTKVKRGENAGRDLSHANIVRSFKRTPVQKKEGKVSLDIPADLKLTNASLIVFVQESSSYHINGAVELVF